MRFSPRYFKKPKRVFEISLIFGKNLYRKVKVIREGEEASVFEKAGWPDWPFQGMSEGSFRDALPCSGDTAWRT